MNKKIILLAVLLFLVFKFGGADIKKTGLQPLNSSRIPRPLYIAHGGGEINGQMHTNSLEALNNSYQKGYRYFEIDFSTTRDGRLVLLHDWRAVFKQLFKQTPKIYSLADFKKLKIAGNLTPVALEDLVDWIGRHPGAYIVTDTKEDNSAVLLHIKTEAPHLLDRFIPQVYQVKEYYWARLLGFKKIIFALYPKYCKIEEVKQFIQSEKPWAVSLPLKNSAKMKLATEFNKKGIFVYTHLVDDEKTAEKLRTLGVNGFYTTRLGP